MFHHPSEVVFILFNIDLMLMEKLSHQSHARQALVDISVLECELQGQWWSMDKCIQNMRFEAGFCPEIPEPHTLLTHMDIQTNTRDTT